jgi:hypothetical protein
MNLVQMIIYSLFWLLFVQLANAIDGGWNVCDWTSALSLDVIVDARIAECVA